ncbi:hypothetical protein WG947_04510 [Pontibacter sp. H259]|uniref:hypothetical protein n=1 Tax=Pontibacter sp. H259 TaxID=3133421 RepID=UPI0030BF8A5A
MKSILKIVFGCLCFATLLYIIISNFDNEAFHDTASAGSEASLTAAEIDNIINQENIDKGQKLEPFASELAKKETEELASRLENRKKEAERSKKVVETIKRSFYFKKDEFQNTGWYKHKVWGNDSFIDRKGLTCTVRDDGYIYLSSNYYSDDWLFHEGVYVKIGDDIYRSDIIPTYDENHRTINAGGSIWENIQYTDGRDNGIIEAIANNTDKIIKVRFLGDEFYSDITLSKRDKLAIQECKRLSDALSNSTL